MIQGEECIMKKLFIFMIMMVLMISGLSACLTKAVDTTAEATINEVSGEIAITRMQGEEAAPVDQEVGGALLQNDIIALNDADAYMVVAISEGINLKLYNQAQAGLNALFGEDSDEVEIALLSPGGKAIIKVEELPEEASVRIMYMRTIVEIKNAPATVYLEALSRGQANVYVKEGNVKMTYTPPGADTEPATYEIGSDLGVEITRGDGVSEPTAFEWAGEIEWDF